MLTDVFFILVFQNSTFSAIKMQNDSKCYLQVDRKSKNKNKQTTPPTTMYSYFRNVYMGRILLNILPARWAKSIGYFEILWVINQGFTQNLLSTPAAYALM